VVIARVNIMSIRSLLLGGLTAAFAAGGFFAGTYRAEAQSPAPLEIKTPNYDLVPGHRMEVVIKAHQKRLGLTDEQVRKVEAITRPLLRKEMAENRNRWQKRVITAEKVAAGEWLPTTTEFSWHFTPKDEKDAVFQRPWIWFGSLYELDIRPKVKAIIGKKAIDQAVTLVNQQYRQDMTKAFNIAMRKGTQDQLALTPLQKKQFAALEKRVTVYFAKQPPRMIGGKPTLPEALVRSIGVEMALNLLDLRQALVLERLMWDGVSVRP
jgi:hypothetical protein